MKKNRKFDEENYDHYFNFSKENKKKSDYRYGHENQGHKYTQKSKKSFFNMNVISREMNKSPEDIFNFFNSSKCLNETIENTDFSVNPQLIMSLTGMIHKLLNFEKEKTNLIMTEVMNSSLFKSTIGSFFKKELLVLLIKDKQNKVKVETYMKFIENCCEIFNYIFSKYSYFSKDLPIFDLTTTIKLMKDILSSDYKPTLTKFEQIGDALKTKLDNVFIDYVKEQEQKQEHKKLSSIKNKNLNVNIDYKASSVEITYEEIYENLEKEISEHIIQGSYQSWEKYFNTLFYLVREDCYKSLRESINIISSKKIHDKTENDHRDVYIYKKGRIEDIYVTNKGIQSTISFETLKSNSIISKKRMLHGNLLVISNISFTKYILAIIFENPNDYIKSNQKRYAQYKKSNPNRLICKILIKTNNEDNVVSFSELYDKEFYIFETKAFYEAYIHLLRRLQVINTLTLPLDMKDIIIDSFYSLNNKIPSTLSSNEYLYINEEKCDFKRGVYPKSVLNMFDDHQMKALHYALTNKIALIQGPPGTGKTYIGTNLTKILLKNYTSNNPLLVVCYTNHALDQFLGHISKFEENIIRIGGRCQDESLLKFTLQNRKKEVRFKRSKITDELKSVYFSLNEVCSRLESYFNNMNKHLKLGIEDFEYYYPKLFRKFITDFHVFLGINLISSKLNEFSKEIYKSYTNEKAMENLIYSIEKMFNLKINSSKMRLNNQLLLSSINDPHQNLVKDKDQIENEVSEEESDDEDFIENQNRREYMNEDYLIINNNENNDEYYFEYEEKILNINYNDSLLTKFENIENLWMLDKKDRDIFLMTLKNDYIKKRELKESDIKVYEELYKRKQELEIMKDLNLIKTARVIGMTTTGFCKYSVLFEEIKFEIVIIEEAAEIFESHVAALLTPNLKHMIMIGDHKQLRPKPFNYEIEKKYKFDVSMFERLINNNYNYAALNYQRRMRPQFSQFIKMIYNNYDDHESTFNRENIKGVCKNMLFFDHRCLEKDDKSMSSKSNVFEAEMIVKFAEYLIKQRYEHEQITILSFYIGQILYIREQIRKLNIGKLRVSSVDNYQGEENDIILLSLVRSNKENNIGFLKNSNRICVALSRAKKGFYIFGNFNTIEQSNSNLTTDFKWMDIINLARKEELISNSLDLICQRHGFITKVTLPSDFNKSSEGGCYQLCKQRLECGHVCEYKCHNFDHLPKHCQKKCERELTCGHKCKKNCNEKCGDCKEIIRVTLKCGHENYIQCKNKADVEKIKCAALCNKKLSCGHICKRKCSDECNPLYCKEKVQVILKCGHNNIKICSEDNDKLKCNEKCNTQLECGHICKGNCYSCMSLTLHKPCEEKCNKIIICNHECKNKCSEPCLCNERCDNICPHGYCNDICSNKCIDCVEKCENKCIHFQCNKLCSEMCDKFCNEPCNLKLKCNHNCIGLCGEKCIDICRICSPDNQIFEIFFGNEDEENALFYKIDDCGHIFELSGLDTYIKSSMITKNKSTHVKLVECPLCKKKILSSKRYMNVVRKFMNSINIIKTKLLSDNLCHEYRKLDSEVNEKLKEVDEKEKNYPDIIKSNIKSYIKTLKKKDYMQLSSISSILSLMKQSYLIYEDYISIKNNNSLLWLDSKLQNLYLNSKDQIDFISNIYFSKYKYYSPLFLNNLYLKISSISILLKLVKVLNLNRNDKFASVIINILYNTKLTLQKEQIEEIDIYLEKLNINVSREKQIFEILSITNGTCWYECPNGHVYTIGGCGMPMEVAVCPECKSLIGGTDHLMVNKENKFIQRID